MMRTALTKTTLITVWWLLAIAHLPLVAAAGNADDKPLEIFRALDNKVATLKQKALEINRDLILIEEESFIPSSAQLVVFFSLEKASRPDLENVHVKLEVDGEVVANHLYTSHEIDALFRTGKHRLYLGNLPVGKHRIVAYFAGTGSASRTNFDTRAAIDFSKAWDRKYIELTMKLPQRGDGPKVEAREF